MSKISRVLAGFQLVFSLVTGVILIFWGVYWQVKGWPAFVSVGHFFAFFFLHPLMFIPLVYTLVKAMPGYCNATRYRVAQGVLCYMHVAALLFFLFHQYPLLPGPGLFEPILERGINLNSLFWLGNDLTPLGLLIGAITGIVPFVLSLHPTVREPL